MSQLIVDNILDWKRFKCLKNDVKISNKKWRERIDYLNKKTWHTGSTYQDFASCYP